VSETTAVAPLLTKALAVLMLMQALMGLLFPEQYRDVGSYVDNVWHVVWKGTVLDFEIRPST
jgi:hypothetical protein